MRIYELRPGSEALFSAEREAPSVGPGEVKVRIRAVSLNHRDLKVAQRTRQAPLIPVSDGAGEVVRSGPV